MRRRFNAIVILVALACATTPRIAPNRYGLEVVPDLVTYQRQARLDPDKELVDLAGFIPGVVLDVRYATTENFMHRQLYPVAAAFLRRPAAQSLRDAQAELAARGIGLKIFDGYRPYRVTEAMWEPIRNPDFVADPSKGSRHNRGAAVDLTLIDRTSGRELTMPTPYDDFTPQARQDYDELPPEVIAKRALLREVMLRHGFEPLPSEWWHFDYRGWQKFELMDVPLEELTAREAPVTTPAPR